MQQDRISIDTLAGTSWHVPIPNLQATRLPPDHFPETGRVATPSGEMALGQLTPHTPILTSVGFMAPSISYLDTDKTWEMLLVPCGALERNWPIADVLLSPVQPLSLRQPPGQEESGALLGTPEGLRDRTTPHILLIEVRGPLIRLFLPKPAVVYMSGLPVLIGKDLYPV